MSSAMQMERCGKEEETQGPKRTEVERWLCDLGQPIGHAIGWLEMHIDGLAASSDEALQMLAWGSGAWRRGEYELAYTAWRLARQYGLSGVKLDELIQLAAAKAGIEMGQVLSLPKRQAAPPVAAISAPTSAQARIIEAYADGSWTSHLHRGGAACVYRHAGQVQIISKAFAGIGLNSNHAEAVAIRLALTIPAFASTSLRIFTDSTTIFAAVNSQECFRLPMETCELIEEIRSLVHARGAQIAFRRTRTGQPLHEMADQIARWVSLVDADISGQNKHF